MAIRPDAMICTGRSDYPNQVNNVLCFPYIFRGALDVGASTINEAMKQAAVNAIAGLARETPSDVVARAYGGEARLFGKDSLIPAPFDPRLILRVAPAVAQGGDGERRRHAAHRRSRGLCREACSASCSAPASSCGRSSRRRRKSPKRVIYADGEDERVLRAAEVVIEEGIAKPILIGRPAVIETPPQALWPHHQAGHGLRHRQPGGRSALPRLCRDAMSRSRAGAASRPMRRARWCAPRPR